MIPIYCISLQRKRNERFCILKKNYLDPMNLNVIEWVAIDGNNYKDTLDISKKNNIKLSNLGLELNKSLIGTAISHRNVWMDIIKTDKKAAVILEDDVTIYPNFKEKVCNIWNIIQYDSNINFLLLSFSNNITINPKETDYNKFINNIKNFNGLFCYLVKKEGAKKLLEYTSNLSYQIDIELCKFPISFHSTKEKLAYFRSDTLTTIHNHRAKLLEIYCGMNFINYHLFNLIDYYIITIYTILLISLAIILSITGCNIFLVNFFNLLFIILDLKLVGCRIDEFNIRIIGLLKDLGSYDSFEIENKLTDHLLFSIVFYLARIFYC